jgi:Lysophospholipase
MDIRESYITASDGLRLYIRSWGCAQEARAVVVLLHGVGEHCQRYDHVAERFCERGFRVLGYDRRGHGRSDGRQGVIGSVDQLVADFSQVIALARTENPGLPVFLYGHSMGALGVLYYSLREKPRVKGIIATSPPLDTRTMTKSQKLLVRVLDPILPNLTVPSGLEQAAISRDSTVIQAYKEDPLVHDKVSVRLGAYLNSAPDYVLEHANEWTLPLYLAHGTADRICPISGSDTFASKVQTPITYQRWEGLYHETHNEPEKERVIGTMLDWIDSQLA